MLRKFNKNGDDARLKPSPRKERAMFCPTLNDNILGVIVKGTGY